MNEGRPAGTCACGRLALPGDVECGRCAVAGEEARAEDRAEGAVEVTLHESDG